MAATYSCSNVCQCEGTAPAGLRNASVRGWRRYKFGLPCDLDHRRSAIGLIPLETKMEDVAMVNPFRIYVGAYAKIAGMDDAGEIILGTYLNGDGSPVSVRDDPFWNAYMMRHRS